MLKHASQSEQSLSIDIISTIVSSQPSTPAPSHYNMKDLNHIIKARNGKHSRLTISSSSSPSPSPLSSGIPPQFNAHRHEKIMHNFLTQFINFGIQTNTKASLSPHPAPIKQKKEVQIQKILKQFNSKHKPQEYRCECNVLELMNSLKKESQLLEQCCEGVSAIISDSDCIKTMNKLLQPFVADLQKQVQDCYKDVDVAALSQQQRMEYILIVFACGQEMEQELNSILYKYDYHALYSLTQSYNRLHSVPFLTLQMIKTHTQNVTQWQQQSAFNKNMGILLASNSGSLQQFLQNFPNPSLRMLIFLTKTISWLSTHLSSPIEREIFHSQKMEEFGQFRIQQYKKYTAAVKLKLKKGELLLLNVRFLMFNYESAELGEKGEGEGGDSRLDRLVLMIMQILASDKIECIFHKIKEKYVPEAIQARLAEQLLGLTPYKAHHPIIYNCLPYLHSSSRISILLSNKQLLQNSDWPYLISIMPKHEQPTFIRSITTQSILLYKNSEIFLNSSLPYEIISPFFEIEIMIMGLKQVLTEGISLNDKQRSKYFGMISVFRGENIPQEYELSMIILEMLFQWYVLNDATYRREYKAIAISLDTNLVEHIGSENLHSFSMKLTENSRIRSSIRIHNYEYTNKIGSRKFIREIQKDSCLSKLYVGYLQSLGEGLVVLSGRREKVIRKSKLEFWTGQFLLKIGSSINSASSRLQIELNKKREEFLNVFSDLGL